MSTGFTPLDWLCLGVYFAATMAVGLWFGLRNRTADGFTAAGRSLPGWVCGLSIMATYLSSISFLALPGKAFAGNWNAFVFSLSIPAAAALAAAVFVRHYRSGGDLSAYAHLQRRFGTWARIYTGSFYMLTQIARMGTVMYLMALPLQGLIGLDLRFLILLTGATVTVYSFVGGITAVIWTDALQAFVLLGGVVVCLTAIAFGLPSGVPNAVATAAAAGKFSLGSLAVADVSTATVWVVLLYGLTLNLQNFGIDQSYVQRYLAARSQAEARKAVWIGGMLYVPLSALFFLIGTGLYAYCEAHPEALAAVRTRVAEQRLAAGGQLATAPGYADMLTAEAGLLAVTDIGDHVFPWFIGSVLPSGVRGLLIAAIFAAAMSTVSTSLNSAATLTLTDVYLPYCRPRAGEREQLGVLRAATVVWGAAGTGMALLLINVASALDAWWVLAGIFGGGMLGLFLLGMVSPTAGPRAGLAGVAAGVAVIFALSLPGLADFLGGFPADTTFHALGDLVSRICPPGIGLIHGFLIPVVGTVTILAVGLLVAGSPFRAAGGASGSLPASPASAAGGAPPTGTP